MLPSGKETVIAECGCGAVRAGAAAAVRKCPVLPVSAIAVEKHVGFEDKAGGPVIDKQEEKANGVVDITSLFIIGSPRRQRGAAGLA